MVSHYRSWVVTSIEFKSLSLVVLEFINVPQSVHFYIESNVPDKIRVKVQLDDTFASGEEFRRKPAPAVLGISLPVL